MTVAELRELLMLLPERFDDTEVVIAGRSGLVHVAELEVDRTRYYRNKYPHIRPERLERKLRVVASHDPWYKVPPEWRLRGTAWPPEASTVGLREEPPA